MRLNAFFRGAVSLLVVALISVGILVGTVGNLSHKSYLAAFTAAMAAAAVLSMAKRYKSKFFCCFEQYSSLVVCVVLGLLCLMVNGTWIIVFHPVQAPDYKTFFQAAKDLASGAQLSSRDYLALFPHILGYASFLSIFLRVFSQSMQTAAVVNLFLTTGIGIVLYSLSLKWTGRRTAAAFVFLLRIFCPSKLLYNTMALSEPYYTFLLFLLMASVVLDREHLREKKQDAIEKDGQERCSFYAPIYGALCGITLTLINSARPIGVIPIIAVIIWFIFLTERGIQKNRRRERGAFLLLLIFSYLASGRIWISYAAEQLGQDPPSIPGYSIYVGFNLETQGSYADEDMELLQNRYFGEYDRNAVITQNSMFESAKERIRTAKNNIPGLMIHKLGTLLGHDEGGAFYSKESFSHKEYALWCILSNCWYYSVCVLSILGSFMFWKQNRSDSFWLVPLCLIGVVLAQLLVEVAARYHYCLIPLLLLQSAFSLIVEETDMI